MTKPLHAAELPASEVVQWRTVHGQANSDIPVAGDVRELMWRHCGLLRDGSAISQAMTRLDAWHVRIRASASSMVFDAEFRRVRSIVTVGLMIARAAFRREEGRGGHFRSDFPNRDDIEWRKHVAD